MCSKVKGNSSGLAWSDPAYSKAFSTGPWPASGE